MKRVMSLLAVVSIALFPTLAGAQDDTGSTCPPTEYPTMPPVPESIDLDTWDFTGTPLFPRTLSSMYLIAFAAPRDPTRAYVYGIDVAANQFVFAGTLSKRFMPLLLMRVGIDIGQLQASGAADPKSSIVVQIEGPPPPPPLPNIHDLSVQNYGKHAHMVGTHAEQVVGMVVN